MTASELIKTIESLISQYEQAENCTVEKLKSVSAVDYGPVSGKATYIGRITTLTVEKQ